MSPALLAGLIRGISTHLWIYEDEPETGGRFRLSPGQYGENGTVSLPTRYVLDVRCRLSVPVSVSSASHGLGSVSGGVAFPDC